MIMFAMTLMGFSCERDDDGDVNTATEITVNDLLGDWHFQSLTFNGVVYDTEEELAELDNTPCGYQDYTYAYIQLSFRNVTTNEIGLFDHRGDASTPYTKNYILLKNKIHFDNDRFVFQIENENNFNGTVLKVKLVSSKFSTPPIGGIYTLVR